MAESIPAAICIGGSITRALATDLIEVIAEAGASLDWGGSRFTPTNVDDLLAAIDADTKLLHLYDDQARWGEFADLEGWLVEHGVAFDRQSDARYEFDGVAVSFRPGIGLIERLATQNGESTVRLVELRRVRELLRAALAEKSPEKVRGALAALEEAMGPEVPALAPFVIVDRDANSP